MDYNAQQKQVREAQLKTALSKEMREARQALAAAEVAEEVAERKYREARDQRRIAEYRLSRVKQLSELEA